MLWLAQPSPNQGGAGGLRQAPTLQPFFKRSPGNADLLGHLLLSHLTAFVHRSGFLDQLSFVVVLGHGVLVTLWGRPGTGKVWPLDQLGSRRPLVAQGDGRVRVCRGS